MDTKGFHIIMELSGCNPELLSNLKEVEKTLVEATKKANATIVSKAFHHFYPQGVSGVVIISESHLSVHTWPEKGYAAIDIYTCGEHTDPWAACEYIADIFEAEKSYYTYFKRGVKDKNRNIYIHNEIDIKGGMELAQKT